MAKLRTNCLKAGLPLMTVAALLTLSQLFAARLLTAQDFTYTPIGGKKPKLVGAKNITFVACRSDNQLAKYKGPRRDAGAAVFKAILTETAAKNLIKPRRIPKSVAALRRELRPALVNGKIPFGTNKNKATLEAEIDECLGNETAVGSGSWGDLLRDTDGAVNVSVRVNQEARTASFDLSVTGFPLGVVDAAQLPEETHSFSLAQGESAGDFSFETAFAPGTVAGNFELDGQGNFSSGGTVLHNQNAGAWAGTQATFTASGPLTGPNLGTVTIQGNFPAGGNNFSVTLAPSS